MWFWIASIPLYCIGFFFIIRSTIRDRREMKHWREQTMKTIEALRQKNTKQIAAMNTAQSTVLSKEDALKKAMDDVIAMFERTGSLKMNDQPYIIKEESELS